MAKEWRFVLRSEFRGEVELFHEPENWRSRETKLVRDMKLYGISLEISSPFVFIKDGYAYVKDCFNRLGYNAQVFIDVFQYDAPSRRYVSYFSGELIMKTVDIEDVRLTVQATPTAIQRQLKDRAGKEVLIDTTFSFDYGYIAFELPQVFVKTHSRIIKRTLSGAWRESRAYTLTSGEFLQLGFDELLINELPGVIKERATIDTTEVFPLIKVEEEGEYTFDVEFLIRVDTANGDELSFFYKINRYGTPVAVPAVFASVSPYNYFTVTCDDTITLKKGDLLYFYAVANRNHVARIYVGGVTGRPTGAPEDKWILTGLTTIGDIFPTGILAYEAVEKSLKNMLGNEVSLLSGALGRTDLGYAVDGLAGMNWIGTGRGLAAKGGQIKTSFQKLFIDGLAPLYNLGMDTDRATDGSPRIIIEEVDYFFTGRVGFEINGVSELRKRVADTLIYDEVKVGFSKWESKLPGSNQDPHTRANYLIPARFVDSTLDLSSSLIASSWLIEEKRRDYLNFTTKTENDNDLFVLNILRNEVGLFETKRDEAYEEVSGVEDADSLYNLDLIPSRVVRRWGRNIAACYYRSADLLQFASAESESALETKLESEDFPVKERDVISSAQLGSPLWLPEVYEFTCKLTAVQDRELLKQRYGIIKVLDNEQNAYYGYLMERSRTEKNEAQFTLLRANYNG
jgi:hypothetical protein